MSRFSALVNITGSCERAGPRQTGRCPCLDDRPDRVIPPACSRRGTGVEPSQQLPRFCERQKISLASPRIKLQKLESAVLYWNTATAADLGECLICSVQVHSWSRSAAGGSLITASRVPGDPRQLATHTMARKKIRYDAGMPPTPHLLRDCGPRDWPRAVRSARLATHAPTAHPPATPPLQRVQLQDPDQGSCIPSGRTGPSHPGGTGQAGHQVG